MQRKILYVCETCLDDYSEACGRFDRKDLVVMPDGAWLCGDCFEETANLEAHGVSIDLEDDEAEWPSFGSFQHPPEYGPITE